MKIKKIKWTKEGEAFIGSYYIGVVVPCAWTGGSGYMLGTTDYDGKHVVMAGNLKSAKKRLRSLLITELKTLQTRINELKDDS